MVFGTDLEGVNQLKVAKPKENDGFQKHKSAKGTKTKGK